MGILDGLLGSGMDDPRTTATLALAQGLLSAPKGMQGLSSGLLGYQGAMQAAQQQQMAQQLHQAQLRGANVNASKGEMDLSMMQQQIERQNRIRDALLKMEQEGQSPPGQPSQGQPAMPPSATPSMAFMPDKNAQLSANAAAMPQATQQQTSAGNLTGNLTSRLVRQANVYAMNGDSETANKMLEQAAKFMPEVKEISVSMRNGQPVNVITYKNGQQEVSGFAPTPKLHFADTGGAIVPVDEYTGKQTNKGIGKTVSPDTVYSGGVTMRGQNINDARERELGSLSVVNDPNTGPYVVNKVTQRAAPVNSLNGTPVPGDAQIKAGKAVSQLQAGIDEARGLIPVATSSGAGALLDKGLAFGGMSRNAADAASRLDTIAGWMTANVPRMEGPQSDKDVMQYRIMAARVGDKTVPVSQRMAALDQLEMLQKKYGEINKSLSPFVQKPAGNHPADITELLQKYGN